MTPLNTLLERAKELKELSVKAKKIVCQVASTGKMNMRVPIQKDDDDMILMDALNGQIELVDDLIEALSSLSKETVGREEMVTVDEDRVVRVNGFNVGVAGAGGHWSSADGADGGKEDSDEKAIKVLVESYRDQVECLAPWFGFTNEDNRKDAVIEAAKEFLVGSDTPDGHRACLHLRDVLDVFGGGPDE